MTGECRFDFWRENITGAGTARGRLLLSVVGAGEATASSSMGARGARAAVRSTVYLCALCLLVTPTPLSAYSEAHRRLQVQGHQCLLGCWDPDTQACITHNIAENCINCVVNGISTMTTTANCQKISDAIDAQNANIEAWNREQERKADEENTKTLLTYGAVFVAIVLVRICTWAALNKKQKNTDEADNIYVAAPGQETA